MNAERLSWIFQRNDTNEQGEAIEVSLALEGDFAYRREVNQTTGRITYARAGRKSRAFNALLVEGDVTQQYFDSDMWIAVHENSTPKGEVES